MIRTSEAAAVMSVLKTCVQGTRARGVAVLRAKFHPKAAMAGYLGHDLETGGPQPFLADLKANEVGADDAAVITQVEVTGATATAIAVGGILPSQSLVNNFHLIRQPERTWQITSRLYHHD